jgi:hypothetical protein
VQLGRLKALKVLGAARESPQVYCQDVDWRFVRSKGEAVASEARAAMIEYFMVAQRRRGVSSVNGAE